MLDLTTFPIGWATIKVEQLLHLYYYCHSEIKMAAANGGYFLKNFKKTNKTQIVYTQDSWIIPTALPIFSWSRNSKKLFTILFGASAEVRNPRWRFSKRKFDLISQPVYNITAKFQKQLPCFKVDKFKKAIPLHTVWYKRQSEIQDGDFKRGNTNSSTCIIQHSCKFLGTINMYFEVEKSRWAISHTLCNASRYQQSKMADHKPEILISRSVYNIAAQFQRLYPCFQGLEIQGNYSALCVMLAEGRNLRWRLTNHEYSSF